MGSCLRLAHRYINNIHSSSSVGRNPLMREMSGSLHARCFTVFTKMLTLSVCWAGNCRCLCSFHSCWSTWVKGRASWTWAWLRPAGLSTHASTTMNWRSQMLERSVTLPWGWHGGYEPPSWSRVMIIDTLCSFLHTLQLSVGKENFAPRTPHCSSLRSHMHHCAHCFQPEWWMTERGKANNRINILSFYPTSGFP